MPARTSLEDRLQRLETRMTALEQLPGRMDRMEIQLVELRGDHAASRNALIARIDDTRREMRVLHEDVLGRIAVIGEGLAANVTGLRALEDKVDRMDARLSSAIDASRAETRAMFEQVFHRLDALKATRNKSQRSKKP